MEASCALDLSDMEEENGNRARSFRYEDYNNRRVFLRSYPLHWEEQEQEQELELVQISKGGKTNTLKQRFVFVIRKVFLLRKLKQKVAVYLVACNPFGFKTSPSLLSV